jgi:hypothetical protein
VQISETATPSGYLTVEEITGSKRRRIPSIIPISRTHWFRKVEQDPLYPRGHVLGKRRVWSRADVLKLRAELAAQGRVR